LSKTIVVAIGGNAITKEDESGTYEEQMHNIKTVVGPIARIIAEGSRVVVVHGNGPQVGNDLIRNEHSKELVPPMPLHVCVANTQGSMGYSLQQQLRHAILKYGVEQEVVTIITQVLVDSNEPSFQNPTKPIGPFYTEDVARELMASMGHQFVEDSGRGWRRVVPSPTPKKIIESKAIKQAIQAGMVVIAAGGGGIPVAEGREGEYRGIDAVIDKDLVAMRLAMDIQAEVLLLLTGVQRVAIRYGRPDQEELEQISVAEAKEYMEAGHFPPGSMGPKIKAAIDFLENSKDGEKVIIGHINEASAVLKGTAGTTITK
jgi:carbamate kinase